MPRRGAVHHSGRSVQFRNETKSFTWPPFDCTPHATPESLCSFASGVIATTGTKKEGRKIHRCLNSRAALHVQSFVDHNRPTAI